jgi:hypothetical protein
LVLADCSDVQSILVLRLKNSSCKRELRVSHFKEEKLGNLECFPEKLGVLFLPSVSECEVFLLIYNQDLNKTNKKQET